MTPRLRTIAACNEQARANIIEGAFASKLPPRNVEAEAQALWRAAVTLATAEPRELRENIGALVEVQEYIERMIERAAK